MSAWLAAVLVSLFASASAMGETVEATAGAPQGQGAVTSRMSRTQADELVLTQELVLSASIDEVWNAYTTVEGWTAWASPKAEIDWRIGGTIRTAYAGEIGGPDTNTLRIVNYVPQRLITLKADVSRNWPQIMREDAENLSNVVLFDQPEPGKTRIQSFGMGYSDAPEYEQLMGFFIQANEGLYANLRAYLERGERADWGR